MRNRLAVPEILEALEHGRHGDLVSVLGDLHPHDAADLIAGLDDEAKITEVMSLLPIELERDVFEYFEPEVQESIVLGSGRGRLRELLGAMASDDRAEFIERLDERVRKQMLPLLTKAVREDLLRRHQFEDDQVGSLLSIEYSALEPEYTAKQAIQEIRKQAPTKETIYYSYVTDHDGTLRGFVSLRKLLLAPPDELIRDLMVPDVVSVPATTDQEAAAQLINDYDLLALPVTDDHNRLLGILTYDDAADILEEEAEEDLEMMAGITSEDRPDSYLAGSVTSQFRRRVPVLTVLAVSFLFIGFVIGHFEETLRAGPGVIMFLLPMIMATGGNVGNQASTAVILGLKHDLTPSAFFVVLWKELRIAIYLAVVLSVIAGIEAFSLLQPGDGSPLAICSAIALAMGMHVIVAALLGAAIPLAFAAMGRDPSMVAHPALATVADLSGAAIYLIIAGAMIPIGG